MELIAWRPSDRRYLIVSVILVFVLAAMLTLFYGVYSVVRVDGESMAPVLHNNDRVLVTRGYDQPHAGDIISFRAITSSGEEIALVKRVVAVAGDSVHIMGDSVYVNGELSRAAPTALVGTTGRQQGPITVPAGSVYVMGDNRPVSLDSRYIGPIPLKFVRGRVVAIILPVTRAGSLDARSGTP